MDNTQSFLEELLTQKCTSHVLEDLKLIDLTGNSQNCRMCSFCAQVNQVPIENVLSIIDLFALKAGNVLPSFPPLKNEIIKNELANIQNSQISIEVIEQFFTILREEIEQAISLAEASAKKSFIEHEAVGQNLYQEWSAIAEIEKLKNHLKQNSEQLKGFLREKWISAEYHAAKLNKIIKQFKENQIDYVKKQEEIKKIIQQVKEFQLFEKNPIIDNNNNLIFSAQTSILKDVNLILSTFGDSSKLSLLKTNQHFIQILNNTSSYNPGDAFLDFILDPKKKYLIRLNYQQTSCLGNYLMFGLVCDETKHQNWACNQQMAYNNQDSNYGIVKIAEVKSSKKKNQESIEIRICLQQQVLKAATFPDYSSIFQLNNPNQINPTVPYRFFVHIGYSKDVLEVTEVMQGEEFIDQIF